MIKEKFNLKDKLVFITGGARGIGRGYAMALAEFGANLAIADNDFENAKKTASEIESSYNVKARAYYMDVRDSSSVKDVIKDVVSFFNRLDIAINNAGIAPRKNMVSEEISDEMWDDIMNVNLRGVFVCCREEALIMIKNGGGNIINTASMSSLVVNGVGHCQYNSSKAGVVMLTKCLAVEWAKYNIRVNCISPGYIFTEMINHEEGKGSHNKFIKLTPMNRLGQVEDLMGAIIFLASDASSFMTGHNLVIDGGYTLP